MYKGMFLNPNEKIPGYSLLAGNGRRNWLVKYAHSGEPSSVKDTHCCRKERCANGSFNLSRVLIANPFRNGIRLFVDADDSRYSASTFQRTAARSLRYFSTQPIALSAEATCETLRHAADILHY